VFTEFAFNQINEGGVTMLFSDIDAIVEPIIKSHDHIFLLHDQDPLKGALDLLNEPYYELPFESSAENMAIWIYNQIKRAGLPITRIELQETESSTIIYEGNE
jgi:6-pyruvoyltetrahydropterin/6-carboxytetrahydropterin synthase